jgi:hypothetical protein
MGGNVRWVTEWSKHTELHPLGLVAIIVLGIAMLIVSRRWAVLPITITACFIAAAQRIVIFGGDFSLLRIIVLFGWARLLLWNEFNGFKWKTVDTFMILWAISGTMAQTLLEGTVAAFINRMGVSYDAVGMYFLFRCLIRNWQDVDYVLRGFILVSIPLAVAFAVEHATGHNAFAFFGGVPAITVIRDGKLRCQGAFSHPILAGCFWASIIPLFAARFIAVPAKRFWTVIGMGCAALVVLFCASSTPVMAILFGVVGACFFSLRYRMRVVRWGLLLILVALHIVMKAPVWHLISRVDIFSGSTGWHRFQVIDQAVIHFNEWWMLGTLSTRNWSAVHAGDITNQFVLEGVRGGVVTLILLITIISLSFRTIGRLWRIAGNDRYHLLMSWALGVSLFVHIMSFFAVSYFGQIIMIWYLLLAIIASLDPGPIFYNLQKTRDELSGKRQNIFTQGSANDAVGKVRELI